MLRYVAQRFVFVESEVFSLQLMQEHGLPRV